MEVTAQTLKELDAGDIPMLVVYNKADRCGMDDLPKVWNNQIHMSALNDVGLDELIALIKDKVYSFNQLQIVVDKKIYFGFIQRTIYKNKIVFLR